MANHATERANSAKGNFRRMPTYRDGRASSLPHVESRAQGGNAGGYSSAAKPFEEMAQDARALCSQYEATGSGCPP